MPSAAATMKSGFMNRTHSDSASSSAAASPPPPKIWRIGSAIRNKTRKNSQRDHRAPSTSSTVTSAPAGHVDTDSPDSSLHLAPSNITSTFTIDQSSESYYRQLVAIVQKMRATPTGPSHVDAAFKEFTKLKAKASALCHGVSQEDIRPHIPARQMSITFGPDISRRKSSLEAPQSPLGGAYDQRSSFSGRSLSEVATNTGASRQLASEAWLSAMRDWRNCLEVLAETFRVSLAETYKSYERDATPEMVENLFHNKRFRKEAVHRMRNASVTRVLSADPQFFPRYEIRFRDYEQVKEDLREIRNLVAAAEVGISPDRKVEEFLIAQKGDTVLEFANLTPEARGDEPVLRFRVSSHVLANTSPVFARMFGGTREAQALHDEDDINDYLPPPPANYTCRDGSEAKLYRMPQYEVNYLEALEVLLHAAHMHSDRVPLEITFDQFVAIAECSMRYKCTAPLEQVVEHTWLPMWMHKGADDMPDGLLVISYAFGLRTLFTRMSKSAVLNLVDEVDLDNKMWPRRIREKVWAVRTAKVEQLYDCCSGTIQEYITPPAPDTQAIQEEPVPPSEQRMNWFSSSSSTQPTAALTSTPRCPKGSHWCDASNLGWLMLVFNELGFLPHIFSLPSASVKSSFSSFRPARSLAQLFDALRRVPNPTAPIHRGGVCDPGPAFRSAVNDIWNSISGLTLHDVSGRSHGWGLSKHKEREPQALITTGLGRMAARDPNHSVATEFPEKVRLLILKAIDDIDDLHSAAMTNWAYYETYKTHELHLMRNIVRHDRIRAAGALQQRLDVRFRKGNTEEKVLTTVSNQIRSVEGRMAADAVTLRSDVDEESEFGDDTATLDGTPAPSVRHAAWTSSQPVTTVQHGRESVVDHEDDEGARPPLEDSSTPSTPRQRSPGPQLRRHDSPAANDDDIPSETNSSIAYDDSQSDSDDEPPMTDEEARRILWPEETIQEVNRLSSPLMNGAAVPAGTKEGLREKFRASDPFFDTEGVLLEDKTLVVMGDKKFWGERDHIRRGGEGSLEDAGDGMAEEAEMQEEQRSLEHP